MLKQGPGKTGQGGQGTEHGPMAATTPEAGRSWPRRRSMEGEFGRRCTGTTAWARSSSRDRQAARRQHAREAAGFMAGQFEPSASFWAGAKSRPHGRRRTGQGGRWSQPLFFQYENIGWGGNRIGNGTDLLRSCWSDARGNGSTLIQFITWSDYTENTAWPPPTRPATRSWTSTATSSTGGRRASSRRATTTGSTWSTASTPRARLLPVPAKREDAGGVIEVLTLLPARRGPSRRPRRRWEAPAGMSLQAISADPRPGRRRIGARRQGRHAAGVARAGHRPALPRAERHGLLLDGVRAALAGGFRRAVPPLIRGEYADDDGDGLPNWFEMYWFGKFLDYSTAIVADPNADPDGDGKSNIEEWRATRTRRSRPPNDVNRLQNHVYRIIFRTRRTEAMNVAMSVAFFAATIFAMF